MNWLKNNVVIQLVQVLGSCTTLFIFLTGFPSLSTFISSIHGGQTGPTDFAGVNGYPSVGMLIIGTPFFIMLSTWLAISAAKLAAYFLTYLRIDCHRFYNNISSVNYIIFLAIVLPLMVGFHLIFIKILFQKPIAVFPITVAATSFVVTTLFFLFWFKKWEYGSCY